MERNGKWQRAKREGMVWDGGEGMEGRGCRVWDAGDGMEGMGQEWDEMEWDGMRSG